MGNPRSVDLADAMLRCVLLLALVAATSSCEPLAISQEGEGEGEGNSDAGEAECDFEEPDTVGCSGEPRACPGFVNEVAARFEGAREALAIGCDTDEDCTIVNPGLLECEDPGLAMTMCPWAVLKKQECAALMTVAHLTTLTCQTCRLADDENCQALGTCPTNSGAECVAGNCVVRY
jgi:hypothetical protein